MLQSVIQQTASQYVEKFNKHNPNKNILDKSYNVTIIRSLIMYFLFLEKKENNKRDFNTTNIANYFGLKTHSTVLKAIDKVELYLNNEKYINSNSQNFQKDFKFYYYLFQRTYNHRKIHS